MPIVKASRRHFLKQTGISFALPILPSLFTRSARAAVESHPPMRAVFMSSPCGVIPEHWFPDYEGKIADLPRCLRPLDSFKQHLTVFKGLWHSQVPGAGHPGEALLLTGANPKSDPTKDWSTTVSIDQLLAPHIGDDTRFESMQLTGSVSGGFGHSQTISYNKQGVPLEAEWRPGHIFAELFGDDRSKAEKKLYQKKKKSVLDLLNDDLKSLRPQLGRQDAQKLDEYVSSVRGLESRLQRQAFWMDKPKPKSPIGEIVYDPKFVVTDGPAHLEWQLDLIWAAIQTDSCRVFSYVVGNMEKGWESVAGLKGSKHGWTHHRGDDKSIEGLARMDEVQCEHYARFLGRLKQTKDTDGSSLLDNTLIFSGSGMEDANRHSGLNLPVLLMGGDKRFRHGQVLNRRLGPGKKDLSELSDVYLAILHGFGIETDRFASSRGVDSDILRA